MGTGPTVLFDGIAGSRTAAFGAWVRSGSAHETVHQAGITHLLEHTLLRRCGTREPQEIAELIDSLGGAIDAFTTHEVCAVTSHVPAECLIEAIDLTLDAVLRACPTDEDVDIERGVVAAEFDLIQDSPSEVVAEKALTACWGDHPLARPVLGDRGVVEKLSRDELVAFHRERFVSNRLLLVLVGPPDADLILKDRFGVFDELPNLATDQVAPSWHTGMLVEPREGLEQFYVNLVFPGLASNDPEVMTLAVLQQLLGAGAASRLFREIRDRLGLVYEIGASVYSTAVTGVLDVAFSAPVRQADACWTAIERVLGEVGRGEISDREVELAQAAIAAGIVLGAEGSDALMEAHAGEFLSRGRRFDAHGLRRELVAVTPERVRALARRVVRLDLASGAICGPDMANVVPPFAARRS